MLAQQKCFWFLFACSSFCPPFVLQSFFAKSDCELSNQVVMVRGERVANLADTETPPYLVVKADRSDSRRPSEEAAYCTRRLFELIKLRNIVFRSHFVNSIP